MQRFFCVIYMLVFYQISSTIIVEVKAGHEKRSLFQDVIQSLRIRSKLPERINHDEDNNISQNFEGYEYEDGLLHVPNDSEFIPRRNDRIEMPSLKYRFPRNINKSGDKTKEKVVLYVDANAHQTSQKPNTEKIRQRPYPNKNKFPNKIKENNGGDNGEEDDKPFSNTMGGQSQIGNREYQTVVKPTVIVNVRGSVRNKDSDIRLEARDDDNSSVPVPNIFNINQEVTIGEDMDKKRKPSIGQEIRLVPKETGRVEEAILTCETATWQPDKTSEDRKFDVLQVLFSI